MMILQFYTQTKRLLSMISEQINRFFLATLKYQFMSLFNQMIHLQLLS